MSIRISVIVAVAQNGVIGDKNTLIWHISEDLKHFKQITSGHPVIMGRKTYESLGRPLPNRTNVVITRQKDYSAPGCVIVNSLEQGIELFADKQCECQSGGEVFIIGGAEIYRQAMPIADRFYLTVVHHDYGGDTYFPEWDGVQWKSAHGAWELVDQQSFECGEKFEYPFTFQLFERR